MSVENEINDRAAVNYAGDIVLLGASNVTRCIGTLVEMSRAKVGSPVRLHIACGHGRSFGKYARVFGRGLPGILQCGLWSALASAREQDDSPRPIYALVTDVGNDIMYGVMPETIARWIGECLDRLLGYDARIVLTALPMCSIETLGRVRYGLTKTIFFPTRSMTYDQAIERARATDEAIRDLGTQRHVPVAEHSARWYGFDPLHIRLSQSRTAWASILEHWCTGRDVASLNRASIWRAWLRLHLAVPETRRVFGLAQGRAQPSMRCGEGTTIGVY